ncbi:MAG: hypothetical protein QOG94_1398 [Solirubrobacteraceae bacterium]|nr:hypothetical protein [Solirubrobacteraceae bacterium]
MTSRRPLVAIEHPDGTAAVVRRGRALCLQDDLRRGGGTMLDGCMPAIVGLGDRTLQGGRLPDGAVAARVTDDAGVRHDAAAAGGAWAIVLDQPAHGHLSPVCFRSADGELVAPELPATWSRVPVADAPEPCPACDEARGWDEVRAHDESRGTCGAGMRPTPFVVCRACGHEHAVGVFYASFEPDAELGADERARRGRELDARLRRDARDTLRDLPFAVYAARGQDARLGGWGSSDGAPSSVTIEHGARAGDGGPALSVHTEHERRAYESERAIASSTLFGELSGDDGDWPQRSAAGLAVALHVRERERLRIAARAMAGERRLLVDGEPLLFRTLAAGARWVAVRRHGELAITVAARDVRPDAVELVALDGPVAELPLGLA